MIKAIIFDFGRVISAWKPQSLFRGYEQALGLAPDTLNPIMFDSPHWQQALVGEIDMDTFWLRIGPELGLTDPRDITAFQTRYYQDEALDPDVHALIQALAGRTRMAILSNHPPGLMDWLRDWALDGFFEVVVCSGDVGVAKPDSGAFTLTLERLGVAPHEAIFIDDTQGHVEAARALGIRACLFTGIDELRADLARLGVETDRPAVG